MKQLLLLTVLCFIIICSCSDHHFHGAGEITTEIRQLQPFDSLVIERNVTVTVIFENISQPYVEITGGEKLIGHLQTAVHNRTLYIKQTSRFNWIRNYRKSTVHVTLHTNAFAFLLYKTYTPLKFINPLENNKFRLEVKNGMGQLDLKLRCDTFELVLHNGSPDILLNGQADHSYFYSNGHGIINAKELQMNKAAIHSRMTADIYVTVTQALGATIEYLGNVYYRGTPQILWLSESHKGRLIHIH